MKGGSGRSWVVGQLAAATGLGPAVNEHSGNREVLGGEETIRDPCGSATLLPVTIPLDCEVREFSHSGQPDWSMMLTKSSR
jgi:hypothetical protein